MDTTAVRRMQVSEILAMRAPMFGETMADWLTRKDVSSAGYRQIKAEMAAEGRTRQPICVTDTVVEGCHRLALAVELGWEWMDVTDSWREAS